MMYSGMMDETTYDRHGSLLRTLFLQGGWRDARDGEVDGHPKLVWPATGDPEKARNSPMKVIAEIDAPSICLRVVVDRLRRMSFMKYNDKAWLGATSSPFRSLEAPDVRKCVEGKRPHMKFLEDKSSNCRYYAGCVLKLLSNFDQIPGISNGLVQLCKGPGPQLRELDPQWMQADNEYWMTPQGSRIFNWVQSLRDQYEPGFADRDPVGFDGFNVGDIVRLWQRGNPGDGLLHVVDGLGSDGWLHGRGPEDAGKLCLTRGEKQMGCYLPAELRHVSADEWMLE